MKPEARKINTRADRGQYTRRVCSERERWRAGGIERDRLWVERLCMGVGGEKAAEAQEGGELPRPKSRSACLPIFLIHCILAMRPTPRFFTICNKQRPPALCYRGQPRLRRRSTMRISNTSTHLKGASGPSVPLRILAYVSTRSLPSHRSLPGCPGGLDGCTYI